MVKKRKKTTKKVVKKKEDFLPSMLSILLYVIAFIVLVFGAWYHKINWILMAFIPFLVAIWYEYMEKYI